MLRFPFCAADGGASRWIMSGDSRVVQR